MADDNIKSDSNKKNVTEDKDAIPAYEDRTKEWMSDEKVKKQLSEIYASIIAGYDDKEEQKRIIERAWEVYNCELSENQMYVGDSKIFLPIVHDAVEARVTRYSNSIFPQTGRYSEVISTN